MERQDLLFLLSPPFSFFLGFGPCKNKGWWRRARRDNRLASSFFPFSFSFFAAGGAIATHRPRRSGRAAEEEAEPVCYFFPSSPFFFFFFSAIEEGGRTARPAVPWFCLVFFVFLAFSLGQLRNVLNAGTGHRSCAFHPQNGKIMQFFPSHFSILALTVRGLSME